VLTVRARRRLTPELAGQGGRVRRFGTVTALGGATGAAILLLTRPDLPARRAPLIAARPCCSRSSPDPGLSHGRGEHSIALNRRFRAAVYVGYFGAARGALLAVLGVMVDEALPGSTRSRT